MIGVGLLVSIETEAGQIAGSLGEQALLVFHDCRDNVQITITIDVDQAESAMNRTTLRTPSPGESRHCAT